MDLRWGFALKLLALLWTVLSGARAGPPCYTTEYQIATEVLDCTVPVENDFQVPMIGGTSATVLVLPAGLNGTEVRFNTYASADFILVDAQTGYCIAGLGCANAMACPLVDGDYVYCITYNGTQIYYSGAVTIPPVEMVVAIQGNVTRDLLLRARFYFNGTAYVSYSSGQMVSNVPCPTVPKPGCAPCTSYKGCRSTEMPYCNATAQVLCVAKPMNSKTFVFQEYQLSSSVAMPGQLSIPTDFCQCCNLPFNSVPVNFGGVLTIDSFSDSSRAGAITLIGRELYLGWLNRDRGGICVGGQRRFVDLTLVGDHSAADLAASGIYHLVTDLDIHLLLGPISPSLVNSSAYMAQGLNAVMTAPVGADNTLFAGRNRVFGMQGPANLELAQAVKMVSQQVSANLNSSSSRCNNGTGCIAYFVEDLPQSTTACNALPDLVAATSMRLVANITVPAGADASTVAQAMLALQGLAPDVSALFICSATEATCFSAISGAQQVNYNPDAVITTGCGISPNYYPTLQNLGRFVFTTSVQTPFLLNLFNNILDMNQTTYQSKFPSFYSYVPLTALQTILQVLLMDYYIDLPRVSTMISDIFGMAALVAGIELANTTEPNAVANAMAAMNISSPMGNLSFSSNQRNGRYRVMQMFATPNTQTFVYPPDDTGTETPLWPKPKWQDYNCYLLTTQETETATSNQPSSYGMQNGTCQLCPPSFVSVYNETTLYRICQPCPPGQFSVQTNDGGRTCITSCNIVSCPGGQEIVGCSCVACNTGYYRSASDTNQSCKPCAPGYMTPFTKSTSCVPCAAGSASFFPASTSCGTCGRGSFSSNAGSTSCTQCAWGFVANQTGSNLCTPCPAGYYSSWNTTACLPCPAGTYQNQPQQGNCLNAVPGASFNGTALVKGTNLDTYWTWQNGSDLRWVFCYLGPENCKANETCLNGSAGLYCGLCTPNYGKVLIPSHNGCFQCPAWMSNAVATGIVVLINIIVSLLLASFILHAKHHVDDDRPALVKLLILYSFVVDAAMRLISRTMHENEELLGYNFVSLLDWLCTIFQLAPGFSIQAESSSWSVACFMQPLANYFSDISEADKAAAFSRVVRTAHSDWFKGDLDLINAKSVVRAVLRWNEIATVSFWFAWPIIVSIAAYALFFVLFLLYCTCGARFYERASGFYWDLEFTPPPGAAPEELSGYTLRAPKSSSKVALTSEEETSEVTTEDIFKKRSKKDWVSFVRAYERRVFGLWWMVPIFTRTRAGWINFNLCRRWAHFNHQYGPLGVTILFVTYGGSLVGLTRPLECITVADTLLMRVANEVGCFNTSDRLFRIAMGGYVGWGLLLPLLLFFLVRRAKRNISIEGVLQEHVGVLTFHSHLESLWWESFVFIVKWALIGCIRISIFTSFVGGQSTLLIMIGLVYGGVFMRQEPYIRAEGRLSARYEGLLICLLISLGVLIKFIQDAVAPPAMAAPQLLVAVLILLCVALNSAFFLRVCYLILWKSVQFIGVETTDAEWSEWDVMCRAGKVSARRQARVNFFRRLQQRWKQQLPYLSFTPALGWVAVCGSRADQAKCPLKGVRHGQYFLSQAPALPREGEVEGEVRMAGAKEMAHLHRMLSSALQSVALSNSIPVFSLSIVDFTIRAGFLLSKEIEAENSLSAYGTRLANALPEGRKAQQASVDPLQIVMESAAEVAKAASRKAKNQELGLGDASKAGVEKPSEKPEDPLDNVVVAARYRQLAVAIGHKERLRRQGVLADSSLESARRVAEMFNPELFEKGVRLDLLEQGFLRLKFLSPNDLAQWVDLFEIRWIKEMRAEAQRRMRAQGLSADAQTQVRKEVATMVDVDVKMKKRKAEDGQELDEEEDSEEEARLKATQGLKLLAWIRLVVKLTSTWPQRRRRYGDSEVDRAQLTGFPTISDVARLTKRRKQRRVEAAKREIQVRKSKQDIDNQQLEDMAGKQAQFLNRNLIADEEEDEEATCKHCGDPMDELSKDEAWGRICSFKRCRKEPQFGCKIARCDYYLCEEHSKGSPEEPEPVDLEASKSLEEVLASWHAQQVEQEEAEAASGPAALQAEAEAAAPGAQPAAELPPDAVSEVISI